MQEITTTQVKRIVESSTTRKEAIDKCMSQFGLNKNQATKLYNDAGFKVSRGISFVLVNDEPTAIVENRETVHI